MRNELWSLFAATSPAGSARRAAYVERASRSALKVVEKRRLLVKQCPPKPNWCAHRRAPEQGLPVKPEDGFEPTTYRLQDAISEGWKAADIPAQGRIPAPHARAGMPRI